MKRTYEISQRHEERTCASDLLYVPPAHDFTYLATHVYHLDFEGSEAEAERLVRETLVDRITQDLHVGDDPALEGFAFHLDYGMKRTALDLEKEAILANWKEMAPSDFVVNDLVVRQRLYLFADGEETPQADDYLRDIVNPAIHTWEVKHA